MKNFCLYLNSRVTTVLFLLLFVLVLLPFPAQAESLSEFEKKLIEYQSVSAERAEVLHKAARDLEVIEEGIAKQTGIPVSRVIKYELLLEETIDYYHSIPFLQKRMLQENTFLIDDETIERILLKKPPYSLLFYLIMLEDLDKCNKQLTESNKAYAITKNNVTESLNKKRHYEREFRRRRDKIEKNEGDALLLNWELLETKANLELCFVTRTFNVLKQKMLESDIKESETKLKILDSLLAKTKDNVQTTQEDYDYLDSLIFKKRQKYEDTIKQLNDRFLQISRIKEKGNQNTPFAKYSVPTEQTLITIESGYLCDMVESGTSMRLTWRIHTDLLEGKLSPQDLKEIEKRIKELDQVSMKHIEDAYGYIQKIRVAERETTRRFDDKIINTADVSLQDRAKFTRNLEAMKNRYLSYVVDLSVLRSQYSFVAREIKSIIEKQAPEEKIQRIWYEKVGGILDFELWHFGDYPIRTSRVLKSLLTLIMGLILTHYISTVFRKRENKRGNMSPHTILLIQKMFYYTGFIISVLLALWTLRIPFAAFAFLGGAFAIALGFGTQRIMSDFFCGTLILLQGNLRVGDYVLIGDLYGVVKEITIQNTVLLSQQCKDLIIPNTKVHESTITNLTLTDSIFRSEVSVSVAYGSDVKQVSRIISEILEADKNVLKKPPFKLFFENFDESGIKITAWFFIDLKKIFSFDAESQVRHSILEEFTKAGIEIPFPQTDIHIKELKK